MADHVDFVGLEYFEYTTDKTRSEGYVSKETGSPFEHYKICKHKFTGKWGGAFEFRGSHINIPDTHDTPEEVFDAFRKRLVIKLTNVLNKAKELQPLKRVK